MTNAQPDSSPPIGFSATETPPYSAGHFLERRTPVEQRYAAGSIFAGKYRIVRLLGEGGMGTVWRAHSLALDMDVAIKVLHRERVPSDATARLLREARATASIGHPAIVKVFDFGETEALEPYLVMELLEGESLAGWIGDRGRVSATLAVQMLLPIADALVAAHERGIVHRDIKPENIVVVPNGPDAYLPKIVDFGVAKLLSSHRVGQVLTEEGMVLGSLDYMSPEQAEGQLAVGEQTDVWAFCVVLYELVTGQRPFCGASSAATIFALYTRDPAPITDHGAGDEELWNILRRGLEKSTTRRWPTMRALGRALAFWAIERGITVDAAETSLVHHWSLSPPEPPAFSERASSRTKSSVPPPSPRANTVEVPPNRDGGARRAFRLPVPRLGTIELRGPTLEHESAPPPPRLRRSGVWPSALGALVVVLVAIITGLGVRLGTRESSPSAIALDPARVAEAKEPNRAREEPEPVVPREPEVTPTDDAAAPPTMAEGSARTDKVRGPSASPKVRKAGMPLPPLPNY